MLVRDVMTASPLTISPETTLPEAASLMKAKGFRRLPVMKGKKLVGIVTDRDIKQAMPSDASSLSIWEINYLLSKLEVKEIMHSPVITIDQDATIQDAANLLLVHKVGGLPVMKDDQLIGMLTVSDVLRAFVTQGDV